MLVFLAVFLGIAFGATILSLPVWRWVESGRQEWQFWIMVIWTIAAYVGCAFGGLRIIAAYRKLIGE